MTEQRDLGHISQDFINALVARIASDVSARLTVTQSVRPRLLTVAQAATYLGRTDKGVRHLASIEAFPSVRGDGRVQFDIQDLDRWIEQNKR